MTNPFDDSDAEFIVLVNHEGQYSLWPIFLDTPGGWKKVSGPAKKEVCVDYINKNWTDMRPLSLIAAMDASSNAEGN